MSETLDIEQFKKFYQEQDVCDCDQRCIKCGKRKRQEVRPFFPSYPNYPAWPQPSFPWIYPAWPPWIYITWTATDSMGGK